MYSMIGGRIDARSTAHGVVALGLVEWIQGVERKDRKATSGVFFSVDTMYSAVTFSPVVH